MTDTRGTNGAWKGVAIASLLIAAAALLITIYRTRSHGFDSPTLISRIKPLNQLTTVRYTVQRVIGIKEEKQPLGEESLLLMVQGNVLAGVDLSDLRPSDVRVLNDHTVAIHLPPPQILQTFIDEKNTKVWDRQITWWTPWVSYDPDLEHKARLAALDDIRNSAIKDGILGSAQKNAQTSIRAFLSAIGMDVKFGGT